MEMKIFIGILMILFLSKIEARKLTFRNQDDASNRDEYAEEISPIFDVVEDSDSDGEEDDATTLDRNEEQMVLEAILKLLQAKYTAKYPQKKSSKKEDNYKQKEDYPPSPKSHKKRQPPNRHGKDRYQNNNYQFNDLKELKQCKLKALCMDKCNWNEIRCKHSCNSKYDLC